MNTDHLGGTSRVVNTQLTTVGRVRYKAFGSERENYGTLYTDKKFTGQTQDASTGLYHYNARSYDPALGRFIQPDSIVSDYRNPPPIQESPYGIIRGRR